MYCSCLLPFFFFFFEPVCAVESYLNKFLFTFFTGCDKSGPLYFGCRRWHFGMFLISSGIVCNILPWQHVELKTSLYRLIVNMSFETTCVSLLLAPSRTCMLAWSALRTCSPGPMRGWMVPVLWSAPRWASSTPTPCCPGPCCSLFAPPTSSKTSCTSKTHGLKVFGSLAWTKHYLEKRLALKKCKKQFFDHLDRMCFCHADICLNCQDCWKAMMSTWELLQGRRLLCFLSWPETWTR